MANYRLEKFPVVPSRNALTQMKTKLSSAQKSNKILRGKHEAINMKLAQIKAERARLLAEFSESMQGAKLTLAKAKFSGLDIPRVITESEERHAKICVQVEKFCIAGTCVPTLVYSELTSPESFPFFGLSRGGEEVINVKKAFRTTLEILIQFASSNYSYKELQKYAHIVRRRLNAIEVVLLPKIVNTLKYIDDELDERDREELYRIRRAKSKCQKHSLLLTGEGGAKRCSNIQDEASALSMLFFDEDKDILFK